MPVVFAERGAQLVISYRSDEVGATETVRLIEAAGDTGKAIHTDFSEQGVQSCSQGHCGQ